MPLGSGCLKRVELGRGLDRISYYTLVSEAWLQRSGSEQLSLKRKPFLRPRLTWMASLSYA